MPQAICLDQVAYGVSEFDQHQTSLAICTTTLHSLSSMILSQVWRAWKLGVFYPFEYRCKNISCVLINWFVHGDGCDPDTEMWTVRQGFDHHGEPTLEVIHLDSIAWVAHLLPIYGQCIPEDFDYHTMLNTYSLLFVNHYIDHHAHEFIRGKQIIFHSIIVS